LDFCYPAEATERIARDCLSLTVLDHHVTAERWMKEAQHQLQHQTNVQILFDMNQSGAGLTARHFDEPDNWFAQYVEDRDLWRFKLPNSKNVNAYIQSLERTYDAYEIAYSTVDVDQANVLGMGANKYLEMYCREVANSARMITFEGYTVPVVNAQPIGISEVLDDLCKQHPVSMGWYQRADKRFVFSLRSNGEVDVAQLAEKYSGGGHKKASGFSLSELPEWL
jgi:oligoribonuclease NrnB/cAMP/cGMP phosphodiesterase (DHH superfamily)